MDTTCSSNTSIEELQNQIMKLEHELQKTLMELVKTQKELRVEKQKNANAKLDEELSKTQMDLLETQKKLQVEKEKNQKTVKLNAKLRLEIEKMNCLLRLYKSTDTSLVTKIDVETQVDEKTLAACLPNDYSIISDISPWQPNVENPDVPPEEGEVKDEPVSIADSIKEAAESAMQMSGYVYDENTGLYYDQTSGYYYDPEKQLYYEPHSGTYYFFDPDSKSYQFHSQVDLSQYGYKNEYQEENPSTVHAVQTPQGLDGEQEKISPLKDEVFKKEKKERKPSQERNYRKRSDKRCERKDDQLEHKTNNNKKDERRKHSRKKRKRNKSSISDDAENVTREKTKRKKHKHNKPEIKTYSAKPTKISKDLKSRRVVLPTSDSIDGKLPSTCFKNVKKESYKNFKKETVLEVCSDIGTQETSLNSTNVVLSVECDSTTADIISTVDPVSQTENLVSVIDDVGMDSSSHVSIDSLKNSANVIGPNMNAYIEFIHNRQQVEESNKVQITKVTEERQMDEYLTNETAQKNIETFEEKNLTSAENDITPTKNIDIENKTLITMSSQPIKDKCNITSFAVKNSPEIATDFQPTKGESSDVKTDVSDVCSDIDLINAKHKETGFDTISLETRTESEAICLDDNNRMDVISDESSMDDQDFNLECIDELVDSVVDDILDSNKETKENVIEDNSKNFICGLEISNKTKTEAHDFVKKEKNCSETKLAIEIESYYSHIKPNPEQSLLNTLDIEPVDKLNKVSKGKSPDGKIKSADVEIKDQVRSGNEEEVVKPSLSSSKTISREKNIKTNVMEEEHTNTKESDLEDGEITDDSSDEEFDLVHDEKKFVQNDNLLITDNNTNSGARECGDGELDTSISTSESGIEDIMETEPGYASTHYPRCIRVMVKESDILEVGTLFILTCFGATIGRDKNLGHAIVLPDSQVSKMHCSVSYNEEIRKYLVKDHATQSGTFLNDQRLSRPKKISDHFAMEHLDTLKIGDTKFDLHIHPGTETCQSCEPGQVQANIAEASKVDTVVLSQADKEKKRKKELKQIKKKYGLENMAYVQAGGNETKNPNYSDKASERRRTVGSDNPYQKDDLPSSVHVAISSENKGHKLLSKMGWKEGESLGKSIEGIKEPIQAELRGSQSAGLGSTMGAAHSIDFVHNANQNRRWLRAQLRYQQAEAQSKSQNNPILSSAQLTEGSAAPGTSSKHLTKKKQTDWVKGKTIEPEKNPDT